uniref:LAM_G_DOMAIN domain-containing protein n=1 Tax=Toxocara canis TaxID=6265 RepID=A0A183U4S7_TOXCA
LEAILCKNGSLNIAISSPTSNYVHTFAFNYTDGYRHFFQSTFGGKTPLSITVDSSKFDFPPEVAKTLSLASAFKYDLGGLVESEAVHDVILVDSSSQKYNYSGCIANIDINLNVGRMHFKPNIYLEDQGAEFARHVAVLGHKLVTGACSPFKIPGTRPGMSGLLFQLFFSSKV